MFDRPAANPFGSLQIIEDCSLVERRLYPRSMPRALRRMKRGFPQHYADFPKKEALHFGNTLVMHPAMAAALRARLGLTKEATHG